MVEVVQTDKVIEARISGHLCGAGIDVLEREPPPDDSKVLRAWRDPGHPAYHRLLVNPHAAYYCEEGCVEFRTKAAPRSFTSVAGQASS